MVCYVLDISCYEVMVSIVRKALIRKITLEPDGLHLHMLVYKKVTKRIGFKRIKQRHFLVTIITLILNFPFMLLANFYKNDTASLALICLWYILIYLAIYFILLPKYAFKNR